MRTSDSIDLLAAALAAAQGKMKNATLNKVNPHFKSKYADLAQIRDTVTPPLAENGIAVTQGTDFIDGTLCVITRLVHKSGQWIESVFPISLDKPQAMGSAYTYAKRYSLSAICNIAADEDDDANSANENAPAAPEPKYARSGIVRAEFERLQKGIHEIEAHGNVEDLSMFWKNNQKIIIALPADWRTELESIKDDAKTALAGKVAA